MEYTEMTQSTTDPKFTFDPMDPTRMKNWEFLAEMREAAPALPIGEHLILTTRHLETANTFKDAKQFSNKGDMRAPGVEVPLEESFLGEMDGELHAAVRRILRAGFTSSAARDLEPWTRENVRRRLRGLSSAAGGDLMDQFSIPLPGSVSARALGIPDEQHDQFMQWCNELLHSTW